MSRMSVIGSEERLKTALIIVADGSVSGESGLGASAESTANSQRLSELLKRNSEAVRARGPLPIDAGFLSDALTRRVPSRPRPALATDG